MFIFIKSKIDLMNKDSLIRFIADNQGSRLQDFYDKSYEKLKNLNDRVNKITIYLIVVVLIYFVLSKTTMSTIQIGPVTINDLVVVAQLLPIVFSYLLFELIITSVHKHEVYTAVKFIFLSLYIQTIETDDLKSNSNNLLTRLILPFSFTTDLSRLTQGKTNVWLGCVGIVLAIPAITLYFLPFTLTYIMLKDIYTYHYEGFLGKTSFYLTIWISALSLFYHIKVAVNNFHDTKNGHDVI